MRLRAPVAASGWAGALVSVVSVRLVLMMKLHPRYQGAVEDGSTICTNRPVEQRDPDDYALASEWHSPRHPRTRRRAPDGPDSLRQRPARLGAVRPDGGRARAQRAYGLGRMHVFVR